MIISETEIRIYWKVELTSQCLVVLEHSAEVQNP